MIQLFRYTRCRMASGTSRAWKLVAHESVVSHAVVKYVFLLEKLMKRYSVEHA
jgi:hypothetical protein